MSIVSFTAALDASGAASANQSYPSQTTVKTAVDAIVTTTVAANVATLVADGASPTQGHVNTLATNWAALLTLINAGIAAADAGALLPAAGVSLQVDTATVPTVSKLQAIFRALAVAALGSGSLTP